MRLPWEVKDLFKDWLSINYPLKAEHVMSRVRQMRGGRENDPEFRLAHARQRRIRGLAERAIRQGLQATGAERTTCGQLDMSQFKPPAPGRPDGSVRLRRSRGAAWR